MNKTVDYPISYQLRIREDMGQTCKACGRRDKFNFHVPDNIWLSVVPIDLQNLVVCMSCFDDFANDKEINYAPFIELLHFVGVGDRVVIDFTAVSTLSD